MNLFSGEFYGKFYAAVFSKIAAHCFAFLNLMSKKKQSTTTTKSLHEAKPKVADEAINETLEGGDSTGRNPREIWRRAIILIPVALAFLSSMNTLWHDFAVDDSQQVLANVVIREVKNLPLAFTKSVWSFASSEIGATSQPYYRPLFSALFTLNYAMFGTSSAFGWHLVNVLIHALVTLLVFLVCREFTESRRLALITASLFAVHPVHAESVAWISGVTDPLMSLFLLPSFYFYLRYRKSEKPYFMALTLLLFLLALWSKETAIALLVVIAYCELFHFNEAAPLKQRVVRSAILAGLFVLPVAIYMVARYQAIGAFVAGDDLRYPLSAALRTIPIAAVKYLWLMTVPVGYSYQHHTPFVMSVASWQFILPLALLVMVVGAMVWSKSRLLKFASLWFFAFLALPLAGIVNFDPEYVVQERYLYLPSMGFCLAVALGVEWLASRQWFARPEPVATALLVLLVVVWGAADLKANSYWYDTIKVFQRVVEADPNSALARASLSITYSSAGRPRDAEAESRKALELDPHCISAYSNLSFFSRQAGKLDEAIGYLEQAKAQVALTPITRTHLATAYLNLGLLYAQRKDFELAEKTLQESNALWSRTIGYYYLGQYYFGRERYEEALSLYQEVARRTPDNYPPVYLGIGSSYERLLQVDKAVAAYNKYLELAPADVPDREEVLTRIRRIQPPTKTK
jgi:protein O-mannosyl-transferase